MAAFASLVRQLAVAAACLAPLAAAAQSYPAKPIRFFVPGPAGGSTDILARLVGQKLGESLGQQVIVDNRPGATSLVSMQALANLPADGYAILLVYTSHVINPLIIPNNPFDPIKDYATIATLSSSPQVLTINASLPVATLPEFIAYAKARPGQLNYATPGTGSANGLMVELLSEAAGIRMQEIPYKGAAPILVDLIGGQVQVYAGTILSVLPSIRSGKIKAVAIDNQTRSPLLPDVPTFAEGGIQGINMKLWFGVVARAGTPRPVVERLSTEINRILAQPDTVSKLQSQGGEPYVSTPEQFETMMKTEMARYARILKAPVPQAGR